MTEILAGPHAIALGVERLSQGKLVVFPTETVYGLGADALDASAVESVFALKGRPASNPLIVHVSGIEMAKTLVSDWPEHAQQIAEAHWPGPVTMVLPKADVVPGIVCADGATVAVRCPGHPCALALIEAFAKPIVGPSANPSGRISPTTPEHVADGFPDADLLVIDGGHCRAGIESSVVDLTGEAVRILRPGIIGPHAISEIIGQSVECVAMNPEGVIAKSPGVVGAHYQPRTPMMVVGSDAIGEAGGAIALIAWSIQAHPSGGLLIPIPSQIEPYAGSIYKALHDADRVADQMTDRVDSSTIWVEEPPAGSGFDELAIRAAVMERLGRATHI